MPYTFSHPAVILPLIKLKTRWLSTTGLIAGSLVPDFQYYLFFSFNNTLGHSLYGLFTYDILIGIAACFLYHNVVRKELYKNLPIFLQSRLYKFQSLNWNLYFKRNWYVVLYSILIGAATHILWDFFTHENNIIAENLNVNSDNKETLQLLHSLAGLSLILLVLVSLKPEPFPPLTNKKLPYWIIWIVLVSGILIWRMNDDRYTINLLYIVVVTSSAFLIAFILTPISLKLCKFLY